LLLCPTTNQTTKHVFENFRGEGIARVAGLIAKPSSKSIFQQELTALRHFHPCRIYANQRRAATANSNNRLCPSSQQREGESTRPCRWREKLCKESVVWMQNKGVGSLAT